MGFPAAVQLCTLNLGQALDAAGNAAHLTASAVTVLDPSGNIKHIIWSATGDSLRTGGNAPASTSGSDDTRLTITVPAVDQDGWETPGDSLTPNVAYKNWSYLVTGTLKWDYGDPTVFAIPCQPLVSQPTIDLDPLRQNDEHAVIGAPTLGGLSIVTSVAGLTGAITAAALAAAIDAAGDTEIAGDITDMSTPVGQAVATNAVAMTYAIGG